MPWPTEIMFAHREWYWSWVVLLLLCRASAIFARDPFWRRRLLFLSAGAGLVGLLITTAALLLPYYTVTRTLE